MVQYAYTEMAGGVNNSRLVSMTYPDGYQLDYNYATSGTLDDRISRLSSLSDSSATLESYKYLGLDTVVERDHPQTGVNLTYISQDGQHRRRRRQVRRPGSFRPRGGPELVRYQHRYVSG